jgi:hypothetical protein
LTVLITEGLRTGTRAIVDGLKEAGIDFVSYLPETRMHDVYDASSRTTPGGRPGHERGRVRLDLRGAWLRRKAVAIFENSGLRVALRRRLARSTRIPVLSCPSAATSATGLAAQPHG